MFSKCCLERKHAIERENFRLLNNMASIVSGEKKHKQDVGVIFNSAMKSAKSPMNLPSIQRSMPRFSMEMKHNSSLNINNRKSEFNRIQVENMVSYS